MLNVKIVDMKPYVHKVNYYETDKMSITHHSNYIRFMEEARIYFLEQIGWNFERLEAEGIGSPVISLTANYKKTTKFPDVINIEIYVEKLSAFKLTFGYIFRVQDEVVFTGTSSHCFLDTNGAPVMLEKRYPDMFAQFKENIREEK